MGRPAVLTFPHADRHGAARIRRVGDLAGNARAILDAVGAGRRAGARARGHARAFAVRLSARGPAAAARVPRRVRARARGARRRRSTARRRLSSGFPSDADGARYNAVAVLRDGRVDARLSQAAPAQLHGVRRGTLLRRPAAQPCVFDVDGMRSASSSARTAGCPRPAAQAREAGAQVIVVPNGSPYHTRQQALRARAGRGARARDAAAVRLRQSRRRPGRARVRRRIVRRRRATARSRSSFRRGTRRSRSPTSTARAPRPVRGALDARARAARVRGAGDGRARLRRARTAFPACCSACRAASIRR